MKLRKFFTIQTNYVLNKKRTDLKLEQLSMFKKTHRFLEIFYLIIYKCCPNLTPWKHAPACSIIEPPNANSRTCDFCFCCCFGFFQQYLFQLFENTQEQQVARSSSVDFFIDSDLGCFVAILNFVQASVAPKCMLCPF